MTSIMGIEAHQGRDIWLHYWTVWCSRCYRSMRVHAATSPIAACPYCKDRAPKMDEDPLG